MVKTDRDLDQKETLSRLQLLMFLRVGFVSLLLGVAIVIQVRETKTYFGEILNAHYFLIALIYFLTFFYIVSLKYIKNLFKFAYLQFLIDTIFITAIIYTTGGIESIFSFLYLLNIISGGIILYRYGGMIIASFSSILYGAFLDLNYYGLINPIGYRFPYAQEYQSSEIFYMILVNVAAFYLVAFLSGFLSEQIRKSRAELKAKQKDIAELEMLKENIIQSISSGLVTLDEHGKIIVFNRGAERIFNIDSRDAIRQDIRDIIPHIMPYLKIYNPHKFSQLSYKRQDDQQIDLLLNISPLKEYDGSKKGEILVFQDTTRIREMEQEVKRMEDLAMLGELAAGIAHEIRNPLASISGSIQVESVRIKIEDNGPGLDPKIAKDIFKPFSTTKKDGSGLGLAIVKRLVEGLGGEVSGENLAREGAMITIILPISIDKEVSNES